MWSEGAVDGIASCLFRPVRCGVGREEKMDEIVGTAMWYVFVLVVRTSRGRR